MASIAPIDLAGARAFTTQYWPEHNRAQGIAWVQSDHALAEYEDSECVGVAIYSVVGGLAYLEQLVVAHGRTKRGTGSRLLQAFEAHAKELGCHVLRLETAETQAPKFYEKHAYRRASTLTDGRFHLDWHTYVKRL